MPTIEIKTGSATGPQPENGRGILIAHIANDEGKWGAGFVLAVNKISLAAKAAYQALAKEHNYSIPRGLVQLVELKPNVFVANMIAQQGVDKSAVANGCLVDYKALEQCLKILFKRALQLNCDVHIPAGVGSGLAGGDRTTIHQMIKTQAQAVEDACDITEFSDDVSVTLWEFTDTSAVSYVGKKSTASKQTVVDNVFGTPDDIDLDKMMEDL